jgi:thioredoxin-related protein
MVLTISMLLLLPGTFHVTAQAFKWSQDKEEVFRLAKEQDRYILLFIGRPTCSNCQKISDIFTTNYYGTQNGSSSTEGPLMPTIENHFIPWYSYCDDEKSSLEVKIYTDHFYSLIDQGYKLALPFLYVINPDDPDNSLVSSQGLRSVADLRSILTFNLLSGSKLKWYEDEATALSLAAEQNKYVFKLIGKGTSPNCQQLMKQLHVDPLKKLLEDNFILLYINASEANIDVNTLSGEDETTDKSFPYFTIIYPPEPDVCLIESWGLKETATIQTILKTYPVANDQILQANKVKVLNNTLQISNQTNNEQIYVFTLTGQQITSVHKKEATIRIDTSSFPKSLLIVYSSTGWSSKIIIP